MSYHEEKKQSGYNTLGRYVNDENATSEAGHKFDNLVGQAAICGTLTVPNLLQYLRPLFVHNAPVDLDDFAHSILEL